MALFVCLAHSVGQSESEDQNRFLFDYIPRQILQYFEQFLQAAISEYQLFEFLVGAHQWNILESFWQSSKVFPKLSILKYTLARIWTRARAKSGLGYVRENRFISDAGIHGPKPIGPGPEPTNFWNFRTEPDQDQHIFENLGPTRTDPCFDAYLSAGAFSSVFDVSSSFFEHLISGDKKITASTIPKIPVTI